MDMDESLRQGEEESSTQRFSTSLEESVDVAEEAQSGVSVSESDASSPDEKTRQQLRHDQNTGDSEEASDDVAFNGGGKTEEKSKSFRSSGGLRASLVNQLTTLNRKSANVRRHRKSFLRELYGLEDTLNRYDASCPNGVDDDPESTMDMTGKEENVFAFDLGEPIHDNSVKINVFRNICGAFINAKLVQMFLTTCIVLNALILGALTFLYNHPKETDILETVDFVLLVLFSVEVAMQIIYLGQLFSKNRWLMFDASVIFFSWIFVDSSVSVLRSFRIFRIFAIIPHWGALRRLVSAVAKTLPNMATIWVSLGLFFYTFSVLYTDLYHDLWEKDVLDYDYFGRLDRTALTLFQMMTLDSWTAVVRQVMEEHPFAWIGFVAWVIITSFFVLNLMVAVICESLIELQNMGDAKRQHRAFRNQRRLIHNQTEYLHKEMRQMLEMQKEMVASQLAMREILLDIAAATGVEPTASKQNSGKGSLRAMIVAAYDDDDAAKKRQESTDMGAGACRRRGSVG